LIVLSTSTDTSPTTGEVLKEELNNMSNIQLQENLDQCETQLIEMIKQKSIPEELRKKAQLIFFYKMELVGRDDTDIKQFLESLCPCFTTTAMGKNDLMLMLLLYPPTTL
jgi:hypothetical protein